MIPFCEATGGGDHVRKMEDELSAVIFNSSGGLLGATNKARSTNLHAYTV